MTYSNFARLPKKIHQKNFFLERLNLGYTFKYYSDDAMLMWIRENCEAEIETIFHSINSRYGAAKADFFRYLVIFKEGGIYLDIKSSCLVPFDTIISPGDKFITSHWSNLNGSPEANFGKHLPLLKDNLREFQNWFLISEPENYIIGETIQIVKRNLTKEVGILGTKFGRNGVLETTGPIAFTKAVAKFVEGDDYRLIESDLKGLVYSIYGPNEVSHHSLFSTHYSNLYEPILVSKKMPFILATLFNYSVKRFYLRLVFKLFRLKN